MARFLQLGERRADFLQALDEELRSRDASLSAAEAADSPDRDDA